MWIGERGGCRSRKGFHRACIKRRDALGTSRYPADVRRKPLEISDHHDRRALSLDVPAKTVRAQFLGRTLSIGTSDRDESRSRSFPTFRVLTECR